MRPRQRLPDRSGKTRSSRAVGGGVAHEINGPVGISLTVASSMERRTAAFAAEVWQGNLKRSSLNDFLEITREASSQLVANLNRAAELIQSFKQVATDRNYSNQRIFDLGDLTEQIVMSLRPGRGSPSMPLTWGSIPLQPFSDASRHLGANSKCRGSRHHFHATCLPPQCATF
jgi:hypothetical protein